MSAMIVCTKCLADRPEDMFQWRNKARGRRHPWCNSCKAADWTARYGRASPPPIGPPPEPALLTAEAEALARIAYEAFVFSGGFGFSDPLWDSVSSHVRGCWALAVQAVLTAARAQQDQWQRDYDAQMDVLKDELQAQWEAEHAQREALAGEVADLRSENARLHMVVTTLLNDPCQLQGHIFTGGSSSPGPETLCSRCARSYGVITADAPPPEVSDAE
jgi:hypothetical protein